ncbi:glycosyltransferase family 4 protein [Akkermansiaceae bacterium]|nr:glycosyltransferase family 4 protein [Akkermansiaceae bacterium]
MNNKRLAILYSHPGSYTRACVKALVDGHGWDVLAIHYRKSSEAPFSDEPLQGIAQCHARDEFTSAQAIVDKVREFGAQVVFMSGWMDKGYLAAAKALRCEGVKVIAGSDTQWNGSLRQFVAEKIAPWYLHPSIDALWVTGERQRQFAWRLGYRGARCWTGMYCCDFHKFDRAAEAAKERGRHFLYVGRYIERKGIDVLLAAYQRYRQEAEEPWELHCAGAGEWKSLLAGIDGVNDLGFIQPESLPQVMAGAGCFVLPSRVEPWGVVVQEAAAAGLPMICSDAAGAAPHLVRERFNGLTFQSESVDELADAMRWIGTKTPDDLERMGQGGRGLAAAYTPEIWARTLMEGVENWA